MTKTDILRILRNTVRGFFAPLVGAARGAVTHTRAVDAEIRAQRQAH